MKKRNKWEKSILIPIIERFIKVTCNLSIYWFIAKKKWGFKDVPALFTELYVLICVILITTVFILIPKTHYIFFCVLIIISIYRLFDIWITSLIILFITYESDSGRYYITTRDPRRWISLALINVYEIILCFSVLFLAFGSGFYRPILDKLTALYQSSVTITTLGYGEIYAINSCAKILVISQLFYFIMFFLLVLPRIFSSIQVKEVGY
jgi:hypothetical protein